MPTLAVLRASGRVGALGLRDQIIEAVLDPSLGLVPMLAQVVRSATALPPDDRQLAGVDSIAAHCRTELEKELSLPPRAPDDWSITGFASGTCCADCTVLAAFLANPSIERTTWPLAKPRRQHLHQRIDEAELPVSHTTIRQGSPHQLVLTKTADVHLRDTERRRARQESLTAVQQFLNATE